MNLSRRSVLAGSVATAALPFVAQAAAPELVAAPAGVQLASLDYPETALWTYDAQAPGPVIRARQGQRITRTLRNALPQDTTIHWHGIRIDNAMDGVPGLSQPPVKPGESFTYDFTAPDAGTYWYHPHVRSWEQNARGLHGPLIIEEADPPQVDRDEVLVLDDWRLDDKAQIDESFAVMHDWSHAGRIGNFVTVNGKTAHTLTTRRFQRLRLRLINVANARVFTLSLKGLVGWVAALDGQPLDTPQPVTRFRLAPAQRADLIVDVTEDAGGEAFLISHERSGDYVLSALAIDGAERKARIDGIIPLPPNDIPQPGDLETAIGAQLLMQGGAMGGMRSAKYKGVETGLRDLVREGRAWAFNGVADGAADQTGAPLLRARLGQTARIAMKNDTRWPHAMHLHGHHFRKVLTSGTLGPLRDTELVDPGETAEIAFVADNPGQWLLHCHMLEHSAAGMSTWIDIV